MAVNVHRLRNAVVGAFLADAATMPLHWIYDNAKLREALGVSVATPEFLDPPQCPFYSSSDYPGHYDRGQPSPYGENAIFTMEFLAEHENWEVADYVDSLRTFQKTYTGRLDHASKKFMANYDEGLRYPNVGADDKQVNSFPKVAPLVARYGETAQLIERTEAMARAHQNNDLLVEITVALALVLEKVVVGESLVAAVEAVKMKTSPQVRSAMDQATGSVEMTTYDMLMQYGHDTNPSNPAAGLSCENPQAMIGALHVLLRATSYEDGVRANIVVGGDNCGRSSIIGAILGALHGVPSDWLAKLKDTDNVERLADRIIARRTAHTEL